MSHLFDNYPTGINTHVPDNTSQKLEIKPDYDEVIVLGADNTHCFKIPHRREEISDIKIIYNQGINTKVIKEYHVYYDTEGNIKDEQGDIHWDYPEDGTPSEPDRWYSLISCDVTAEETNNFNGYNQDVNIQIFTTILNGKWELLQEELSALDLMEVYEGDLSYKDHFIIDFGKPCNFDASDIYKVKIVRKLEERVEKNSDEGEITNG